MIPEFDIHGVIPPVRLGDEGHSLERSPYPTDMLTICQRFGTTAERRVILRGLLDLRKEGDVSGNVAAEKGRLFLGLSCFRDLDASHDLIASRDCR